MEDSFYSDHVHLFCIFQKIFEITPSSSSTTPAPLQGFGLREEVCDSTQLLVHTEEFSHTQGHKYRQTHTHTHT